MTRSPRTLERSRPVSTRRHDQRHDQPEAAEAETLTQREANLFHLLSHPARLALLEALRHDAACVCHLEALLGYPQAYISQQLAVLRSAGLIEGQRDGWNIYYHICDARLFAVFDAARALLSPAFAPPLAQPANQEPGAIVPGCACPRCAVAPVASAGGAAPA